MVQFETLVRWMDERKDERRKEIICLRFCFLGVAGIKHGVVIVEELVNLSRKIYNWRSLAVRLGFEEENIAAINLDYQAISEKAFAMLLRWRQREGSAASYQVLYDALCHPFVNRRDLAEESCMRIDERSVLVST